MPGGRAHLPRDAERQRRRVRTGGGGAGDRALANLRLLFAGLPRLEAPLQVVKAQAAAWLLDHGLSPRELMRELGLDTAALDAVADQFGKYNPAQPACRPATARRAGDGSRTVRGRRSRFEHGPAEVTFQVLS